MSAKANHASGVMFVFSAFFLKLNSETRIQKKLL